MADNIFQRKFCLNGPYKRTMKSTIPVYLETIASAAANTRGKQLASLTSLSDSHVDNILEHNVQVRK